MTLGPARSPTPRPYATDISTTPFHYTFRLDAKQPTLLAEAKRLVGGRALEEADAHSVDVKGATLVHRHVFLTDEAAGYHGWSHLRTMSRVRREVWSKAGELLSSEDRYYLSSLAVDRLSDKHWLKLLRLRWGVENEGHHTLDVALREDKRPWITGEPVGMVAVLLLRRLAYNLLALFRKVTQRSDEKRRTP
jgi:hypothetical protein